MTDKIALVIKASGVTEYVTITSKNAYNVVSGAVGGYVERVAFYNPNLNLWVNEEGKLTGLPFNIKASNLWAHFYGHTDVIMGDAVVTGGDDSNGNTKGLTKAQLAFLDKVVGLPAIVLA